MSVLELNGVSKSYGPVKALDGISFTHTGGFYALLGQNGAGKSTLFQLLTGLFVPDSGDIHIAGKDLKKDRVAVLNDIGVVFQQSSLDLDMTVRANLSFYGRLRGMSKSAIRQCASEELDRLGLMDSIDKPCRALSGGNRRKVELARALMGDPKLLLMDEPTVGLDPASRESLVRYVYQLCQDKNLATLWATHLVDEAEDANQILVVHLGKLKTQGNAQELRSTTHSDSLLDAFLALAQ